MKHIQTLVSDELHQCLVIRALKEGVTLQELVRDMLKRQCPEHSDKEKENQNG